MLPSQRAQIYQLRRLEKRGTSARRPREVAIPFGDPNQHWNFPASGLQLAESKCWAADVAAADVAAAPFMR